MTNKTWVERLSLSDRNDEVDLQISELALYAGLD